MNPRFRDSIIVKTGSFTNQYASDHDHILCSIAKLYHTDKKKKETQAI